MEKGIGMAMGMEMGKGGGWMACPIICFVDLLVIGLYLYAYHLAFSI